MDSVSAWKEVWKRWKEASVSASVVTVQLLQGKQTVRPWFLNRYSCMHLATSTVAGLEI